MTTHQSTKGKNTAIGDETVLKVAKEIAIKFIEMGRITPASFDQNFRDIFATIKSTATTTEEDA